MDCYKQMHNVHDLFHHGINYLSESYTKRRCYILGINRYLVLGKKMILSQAVVIVVILKA